MFCWQKNRVRLSLLCLLSANVSVASDLLKQQLLLPSVNYQAPLANAILCLRDNNGKVFISVGDWQKLKLKTPQITPITHKGVFYYPLDSIQGVNYQIDESRSTLALIADANFFAPIVKDLASTDAEGHSLFTSVGAYVNYDVLTRHVSDTFNNQAFIEGVAFAPLGILENQLLVRDLAEKNLDTIRLNTSFTHHQPQQLYTLKVGDSISRDIALGANVRFAGLQWGTNFALQPNKITVPQPSINGASAIPSTAEIFINNAKRASEKLPVGPFTIQNLPVVTGQGQAKVVVTDILGQEQEIIVPYYVSPQSLRAGLSDYAVQLGVIRQNYGIDSQNYGHPFASVVHRVGINNQFTLEVEGQLSRHLQMLSYGTVLNFQNLGALHAVAALSSNEDTKQGSALYLAVSRQQPHLNVGANMTVQSREYVNIGSFEQQQPNHYVGQLFANIPIRFNGSLSASYSYQQPFDAAKFDFIQANYSVNLGRFGTLAAALTHTFGSKQDTLTQLNYSLPLGYSTNTYLSLYPEQDRRRLSVQRNLQKGEDWGYSLATERGKVERDEASLLWQNRVGRYALKAEHLNQHTDTEARVSGSVAFLAGEAFLGQRIDKGFAVVQVPDFNNVRIYHDNRLMGKTSNTGTLMIPQLRPYQKNTLRLAVEDLPLDAQLNTATIDVTPTFRSGLYVKFPVKKSYSATLKLLQVNGQVVPTGATLQNVQSQDIFSVGLKGKVYLTGLSTTPQTFLVKWDESSCTIEVALKTLNQVQSNLGDYTCQPQAKDLP